MDAPLASAEDEVDEQDVLLMRNLLSLSPAKRLGYLYGMIEWQRIARTARRIG